MSDLENFDADAGVTTDDEQPTTNPFQTGDPVMDATQGLAQGFEDLEEAKEVDKDQKIADFEAPTERPDKDNKDEDKNE